MSRAIVRHAVFADDSDVDGDEEDPCPVSQRLGATDRTDEDYAPSAGVSRQAENMQPRSKSARISGPPRPASQQHPVPQAPVPQAPVLQAPVPQAPVLQAPVPQAPVLQPPEDFDDLLVRLHQSANATQQRAKQREVELSEALKRAERAEVKQSEAEVKQSEAEVELSETKVELSEEKVEVAAALARNSQMAAAEKLLYNELDQLDVCAYPDCRVSSTQQISQNPSSWRTAFAFCKFGCRTCAEHVLPEVSERLAILEKDPCAVTSSIKCNCGEPFTQIELEHVLPREAPRLFKAAEKAVFHRKEEELRDAIDELRHQAELAKTCSTCYAVDTGTYVCLPCGHRIACDECVRDVRVQASQSCFSCRAPHTGQFMKVFGD